MTNYKEKKELEDIATQLTGIAPINDYEYQACYYSRPSKGRCIQERKKLFKSSKRII